MNEQVSECLNKKMIKKMAGWMDEWKWKTEWLIERWRKYIQESSDKFVFLCKDAWMEEWVLGLMDC